MPRTEPFVGKPGAVAERTQKVTVYELATGRPTTVWPIDARELVASGEYSSTPPVPADPPPAPDPAPPVPRDVADPSPTDPAPAEPTAAPEPTAARRARSR